VRSPPRRFSPLIPLQSSGRFILAVYGYVSFSLPRSPSKAIYLPPLIVWRIEAELLNRVLSESLSRVYPSRIVSV